MKSSADYRPYDYAGGPVSYVTVAMARRLVRLAYKVARESVDANVIEEARRLADEIKVSRLNRVELPQRRERMRALRARRRDGGQAA